MLFPQPAFQQPHCLAVLVRPLQEELGPQPRVHLEEGVVVVLTPRSLVVMIQELLGEQESPVHPIRSEHSLNQFSTNVGYCQ